MKHFIIVVILLCNVTADGQDDSEWKIPKNKENFHVFLLMGQSNMNGGGNLQKDLPHVLFIPPKEKEWAAAKLGKLRNCGLGVEFSKAYMKKHPDVTVGLVPLARGGTQIGGLHKGTAAYAEAMEKAAIAKKSGVIKGVLWHQGESDTVHPHLAKAYADRLLTLVKDIRIELNDDKLPFVVGDLGEFYGTGKYHIKNVASIEVVRKALRGLPAKVPHTGFADSTDCKHRGDFVHFDNEAYITLGKNYAEAYESAVAGKNSQEDFTSSPQNTARP
jgi:hypothetical protein